MAVTHRCILLVRLFRLSLLLFLIDRDIFVQWLVTVLVTASLVPSIS